jgi:NADPH2:quinone reductase
MKALFFESFGGPDVLQYGDVPDPVPEAGTTLVGTSAIGLNFADVYRRRGNYHLVGRSPFIAGYEAAGAIVDPGADAPAHLRVGTRVAFADSPRANAELVAVPYDKLIPLPDDIGEDIAAGLLLQGLTVSLPASSWACRRVR